ncbi:MAG: glyceraldehyde-3-phosphate dehydrogenase [Rhodobacteraceae bacterium]|nr:glyceraldehyde-3-phosphate dehydrogenase [Paracoccaceae bacterium]MCW9042667.1 glyceraldehyde-3-phosphate dehydrogenase [Pseudopelagicola sp.]
MTNPIAVFLAVLIFGGLAYDLIWLDGQATLLLTRKLFELIEWLAFWR